MNRQDDEILPNGWAKTFSKRYKRYYYSHIETKTSQWHPPTVSEVQDPNKAKELADQNYRKFQENSKKTILTSSHKKRPSNDSSQHVSTNEHKRMKVSKDARSVAIIVPFRDIHKEQNRSKHLSQFLPHMQQFLERQITKGKLWNYHVYIIEQSNDDRKFNRGKLLNIGFDYAITHGNQKGWNHDIFIFHDVDLLPGEDLGVWYSTFPKRPIHIARCWDRYANNPKYFGGIVSFSEKDMKRINGFPNTFWGWGGEDDEMQKRCEKLEIKWEYPPKVSADFEEMSTRFHFLRFIWFN